jgi:hypothetical protein
MCLPPNKRPQAPHDQSSPKPKSTLKGQTYVSAPEQAPHDQSSPKPKSTLKGQTYVSAPEQTPHDQSSGQTHVSAPEQAAQTPFNLHPNQFQIPHAKRPQSCLSL